MLCGRRVNWGGGDDTIFALLLDTGIFLIYKNVDYFSAVYGCFRRKSYKKNYTFSTPLVHKEISL